MLRETTMNDTIRNTFVTLAKFGLAGAVIFGIAMVILTQDSSPKAAPGQVKSAEADIVDLAGKDGSEFTRAMLSLGFKPRAYDLNGNVMYFASGYVDRKTPTQVMNTVQEEMVNYGVNSRNWLKEEPLAKSVATPAMADKAQKNPDMLEPYVDHATAMLAGEVVPLRKERDYISVGSVTGAQDVQQTMEDYAEVGAEKKPLRDQLGGYRFIDATAEPELDRTMMTAVWTDDEFDPAKMENRAFKQQPADPAVPACMGCERNFRMQSLNKGENFNQNMWTTHNQGMDRTYRFYQQAMANRGWRESGVQSKLNKLADVLPEVRAIPGRTMNLEKGGKQMTITLLPSTRGGTAVFSSEEYDGGQMILGE